MRIPTPYSRKKARIEIIPLIDIVFFLLATFVMVSMSMIKNQSINVHLPTASTSEPEERKHAVSIAVTENGEVYWEKEKITFEELAPRLNEVKTSDQDVKVFIHGDEQASFGDAIKVLDEIRKQGILKIAIQTTKPSEPSDKL